MKKIELRGKYAVGEYVYTLVDDDQYLELNKHKWKAKPNGSGSNVYAIRTTKIDGKTKDIRMHRVVLGVDYDGVHDIDHINRNSLDNRRENLRLCTRSENVKNTLYDRSVNFRGIHGGIRPSMYLCVPHTCNIGFGLCIECGDAFVDRSGRQKFCSDDCRYKNKNRSNRITDEQGQCAECGKDFANPSGRGKYCSVACRRNAWNQKRRFQ